MGPSGEDKDGSSTLRGVGIAYLPGGPSNNKLTSGFLGADVLSPTLKNRSVDFVESFQKPRFVWDTGVDVDLSFSLCVISLCFSLVIVTVFLEDDLGLTF